MPGQRNANRQGTVRNGQQPLDFAYGHVMPQAPEVEKAVLGALMIDKDAYMEVCNLLVPESFYEPRNQMVYEAIQQLSREESPVDVLTVTDMLGKMGKLEEVGGPGYIMDLSSRVATSANIEYHANVVAEKYLSRQMIQYVNVIGKKSFDETYDIRDVVQEAESVLLELSQKNMKKDYSALGSVVERAVKAVEEAYANKGSFTGIPSGLYKLDDMTCGWQKSDLVIIAGRPAMGKTAFALSVAKNIAVDQKRPMAFFSLEMSDVQLADLRESGAIEQDADMVIFLHRPEYYHILKSEDGFIDYKDKAEIIIAKHRKGATGIVMMDFKGEFTRFANPEDKVISKSPREGGEIRDSGVNGRNEDLPFPPEDAMSFDAEVMNDH